MSGYDFSLASARLTARASGALWWPAQRLLCVSDLHLGKSERIARRGGAMLPPYEIRDTLTRLEAEITATDPLRIVCLGDSFDDLTAATALPEAERLWIKRLQSGRDWVWITGNHDPAPTGLGGEAHGEWQLNGLTFRHIAEPGASAEISGHYHPKARLSLKGRRVSRPCFLVDASRAVMPAFGTYTGGLDWTAAPLLDLMADPAFAVLTGPVAHALPRPIRRAGGM